MVIWIPKWKWMGSFTLVLITLLLLVQRCAISPQVYVALGDYFSSGISIEGEVQDSFVDFLGEKLIENHRVNSYSKLFTYPRMDSDDLLRLVSSDSFAKDGDQTIQLSRLLQQARIITVSIGAQDWLSHMVYDPQLNTISFDFEIMERTLSIMQNNVFDALVTLQTLSPNATIVVTGYYFMFPFIAEEQKPLMTSLFQQFQSYLMQASLDAEVHYLMPQGVSYNEGFLEPNEIYLSEVGHHEVAEVVWTLLESQTLG